MKSAILVLVVVGLFGNAIARGDESTTRSEADEVAALKRENEQLRAEIDKLKKRVKDYEQQLKTAVMLARGTSAFSTAFIADDPAVRKWAVKVLVEHYKDYPQQIEPRLQNIISEDKDESVREEAIKVYRAYLEKQKALPPAKPSEK